jgi:transposase InsO family protein
LVNDPEDVYPLTKEGIKEATRLDPVLPNVLKALETGEWTEQTENYKKIAEELRDVNGILMRLGAVVVPVTLRNEALRAAHEGHPGQSAMLSIMRARVWWPGMPAEARAFVANCRGCQLVSRAERPVPMLSTTLPEAPWDRLAVDFNGPHGALNGESILVVVDYYTRYLLAEFVVSTDFKSVKPMIVRTFATFGNPVSIRSDNGPPFNGREWRTFCRRRGITIELSTPGHPQQNGLVERYMQPCNDAVTRALAQGEDVRVALEKAVQARNAADHRTTAVPPEALMFGRRLRRDLPLFSNPKYLVDESKLRERDASEKQKGRERENQKRGAKETDIGVGDTVLLKRWAKAKDQTKFEQRQFTVIEASRGDMTIQDENGRKLKRNVIHLKKVRPLHPRDGSESSEEEVVTDQRPRRERRPPPRLSDYVQVVTMEK